MFFQLYPQEVKNTASFFFNSGWAGDKRPPFSSVSRLIGHFLHLVAEYLHPGTASLAG